MSRNLCTDTCVCGKYQFSLKDFVGKPIEFRKYGPYVPHMGCKLFCPECGKIYFGWVRICDHFWETPEDAFNLIIGREKDKGKFVHRFSDGHLEQTGYYQIDLSFYETFNDEGEGIDTKDPAYLLTENDSTTHWEY